VPNIYDNLRPYQSRAIAEWEAAPERAVCIVAPTGAGKSVLGRTIAAGAVHAGQRVLWLAHRIELLTQAVGHLAATDTYAGILAAGYDRDPHAPVQCASVDTLLARPADRPPAELIVWDEAHHSVAETYRTLLDSYPAARIVGLTATPQRQDGKPLGDIFSRLVIAAQYSELLSAGHIAPCRVFRPDENLKGDLACQPLDAYRKCGNGERGFGFANSVTTAAQLADQFTADGIPSAAISGKTGTQERADILARFKSGALRFLWNMHVLTEGVDVPDASVCILARGVGHAGPYLQMVGRVLRTHPGKAQARLLDLSGASHTHGLPTSDREYALHGRAIRCAEEPVRNCPACGCTYECSLDTCPECGHTPERQARQLPRIWNLELREAIEGAGGDPSLVGSGQKAGEWLRLLSLCRDRQWSLSWAAKKYRELFQEDPPLELVSGPQRLAELTLLTREARTRGHKAGAAAHRYKSLFGGWPSKAMKAEAERMA
jgi:DNA repair protein RadD